MGNDIIKSVTNYMNRLLKINTKPTNEQSRSLFFVDKKN